jgi:hypothetical protein
MNKLLYLVCTFVFLVGIYGTAEAGNPDRQGEAGAAELLMNPWARSAGLHTMNTSSVTGVEALRLNIAGMSRINKTEIVASHALYLQGTDIRMNAFGLSQKVGKSGAFGLSIMALDFGDIRVTTTNQPEGTGTFYSPNFFNIGFGYATTFENKVSVGILFRGVSESTTDIAAFGFAIDAGVQYVTGPQDNFKFGISLRNIGSPMSFSGEGLATQGPSPDGDTYELTFSQRSASFELPSVLNIGASYDFLFGSKHKLTAMGNFTSNSFSQDQVGGGLEYSLNDMFLLRGGYKFEFGSNNEIEAPIYTGISAGASIMVPLSKVTDDNKLPAKFGIDYAYRQTKLWNGTHNISVRFVL